MMLALLAGLIVGQGDRIQYWQAAVKQRPGPANYRGLADALVDAQFYQRASDYYLMAAKGYLATGDPNAYKVLAEKSNRFRSSVQLYVVQPTQLADVMPLYTRAKWEPFYGCYLGANIDREDAIDDTFMDGDQTYREPGLFNQAVGKHHAVFFTYLAYGRRFPAHWVKLMADANAGVQIAWEPSSLEQVQDDDYLHRFAEMAAASGGPVFLRFASEMNGDWTASTYGGNPALYREKFQLVARVMHAMAPNVAMVWCPNEIPEATIPSYFPGDDAVDWVGVNFYSVLYTDGDRARSADWRNPVDALDYIYRTYSAKHPIMVGEWAATHRSVADDSDRDDFAITKIRQFYSALPLRYPRVKSVNWLSMNTMRYAEGDRKLNDFSLMSKPDIAQAFGQAVSSPYYLDSIPTEAPASTIRYVPLTSKTTIHAGDQVVADVRCYDPSPTVVWSEDGKEIGRTSNVGAATISLTKSPTRFIQAELRDHNGRQVLLLKLPTHG
jgi:hypothetical protein